MPTTIAKGRNTLAGGVVAFCFFAACFASVPAGAEAPRGIPLYKDPNASIEARVRDLLGRMTLDEKIAQLQGNSTLPSFPGNLLGPTPASGLFKDGDIDEAIARSALGKGIGAFAVFEFQPKTASEIARKSNLIQRWVMQNTRLGVPVMFQGEALHGAMVAGATGFPQAVALGSTWNPMLVREMFGTVAKQARQAGFSMVLAPVLDLARDPRYGRVEEMYSEDPYLVGEIGLAAIQGLQGPEGAIDQDHVIATAKHFVHGQPEGGTNTAPSDYSERTMRATFLPPFRKAVTVGHIGAVMPSYNEIDGGIPSSASDWLLKDVLRGEWGFTGVTGSDWFAIPDLQRAHRLVATLPEAGILAFNSGMDMEAPNGSAFATLTDAVRDGKVAEADIDAAVSRVLGLKFRAGLFEHPYTGEEAATSPVRAAALARKVADEAAVLLKNDNDLLPLDPKRVHKIAVIGPNADKARIGGYAAVPPYFVTVLDGIRKRVGPQVAVSYAEGVRISEPDRDGPSNKMTPFKAPPVESDTAGIAQAVATAREADVVVLVLGDNETVTREAFNGAPGSEPLLGDTDDLRLPGRQEELVQAIAKVGKPTVAVLLNGRARTITSLSQSVPAILEGWYLGQETGNAVAGILFGDVNPSGRLPVTIPRNVGQVPVFYYHTPKARLGYVGSDSTPLYPFGFGLGYAKIDYGKVSLDRTRISRDGVAKISVQVTNRGDVAAQEVVQMYVHPQRSSVVQPVLRLARFQKIALKPNESRTVSFDVGPEQLAILDRKMRWTVEPGAVDVMVGPNARDYETVTLEVTP